MWTELVEFARQEGLNMPYKSKQAKWVVELGGREGALLKGPYDRFALRRINAPDRQRSGTISQANLKPYLLFDDARYVLGIADPGKEAVAKLAHGAFMSVLSDAAETMADEDLRTALAVLKYPSKEWLKQIEPRDWITFQATNGEFLCEREAVQEFWLNYLAQGLATGETASCTCCGNRCSPVRILLRDVVVMGQKTSVASFNKPPYDSHGKEKMANAPTCYECATGAVEAIDYLARTPRHRAALIRQRRGEGARPLGNQLAVFWLKQPQTLEVEDEEVDLLEAFASILRGERGEGGEGFSADLAMVDRLLRAPLEGQQASTILPVNAFYLAILSANRGRLTVRDWLEAPLERLRQSVASYLGATKIVDVDGGLAKPFTIPRLVEGLEMYDVARGRGLHEVSPNLVRSLVRTAYLGHPPPDELLNHAVQRFRVSILSSSNRSRQRRRDEDVHAQAAALKLWLAYNDRSQLMETDELDTTIETPAYLCGRLLAILEEAQQRAAHWTLSTTLVDRYYPAASSAPAMTFGVLLKQASSAHMPKIAREGRGYRALEEILEELLTALARQGGFPQTLVMRDQANFALGFYCQRGWFRAHRGASRSQTTAATASTR